MEMRRKQERELRGGRGWFAATVLNFKDHIHMGLPWWSSG